MLTGTISSKMTDGNMLALQKEKTVKLSVAREIFTTWEHCMKVEEKALTSHAAQVGSAPIGTGMPKILLGKNMLGMFTKELEAT